MYGKGLIPTFTVPAFLISYVCEGFLQMTRVYVALMAPSYLSLNQGTAL